uniref:Uncharacterized protein n=1 Tax=Hucho hucho TaxID=62062 RepID=A0A4W5NKV2_9TELE
MFHLPSMRLPCSDIESLLVIEKHVLEGHIQDHCELETMFSHYTQCRIQWLFTYWLFRQPSSFDRQLRAIYLQWRKHSKRKVASWGGTLCDVCYL